MSLKISAEQKALESRRNALQVKRKSLNQEIKDKQQESGLMKSQIDKLQKEIEDLKKKAPKKLIVSEHAMLRYISRVIGINLEEIEDKVLTEGVVDSYQTLGDGKYRTGDFKVVIKGGTVVTVE